jgi:lipoprotein-anchoring transpeptidase ErfK/SrfK
VSDLKRHAIFFYYGFAIHGTNNISQLGGPASHGCVRLHPANAATLFGLVQHSGPRDTTIQISNEAIDLAYRARLD